MNIAPDTRNQSFHALDAKGRKQREVLSCIQQRGPLSDRQIAVILGWPINRVTGRRNELAAAGAIVRHGTANDQTTQRTVATWRVSEPVIRKSLFE